MKLEKQDDGSYISESGLAHFVPNGLGGGTLTIYREPANLGQTSYVVEIDKTGDYGTMAILSAALNALAELGMNNDETNRS